jgi:hypothetical protein
MCPRMKASCMWPSSSTSTLGGWGRLVDGPPSLRAELVIDALEMMALWRRKPAAGLVHHSDRGVQYTSLSFGKRLEEAGIVPSPWVGRDRRWITPSRRASWRA